jgi:hypothetical protein
MATYSWPKIKPSKEPGRRRRLACEISLRTTRRYNIEESILTVTAEITSDPVM